MSNNNPKLNPLWQARYKTARVFVYIIFVLLLLLAAYLVLFPSANFIFSFSNPDSLKNTVADPRIENGTSVRNGNVSLNDKLVFDSNLMGDYSKIDVVFTLSSKSDEIAEGTVSARKSFRAFFYPTGDSISKIETPQLFKVGNDYYQLIDNTLRKFVSEKAYLSKYSAEQAISKDESFLKNYPLSEEFLGFRDGTLLSSGISVYAVSGVGIWPINNPVTFESMGWDWNDVIPASGEEIAIYQKEKLFTLKSPHPDGTVFFDQETGKYYLISGGEKHELIGKNVIDFYSKTHPIPAEEKNLSIKENCDLTKSFGLSKKYACSIPITEMKGLTGNDFQFEAYFGNDVDIQNISVTFKKEVNIANMKSSLSILKNRTLLNYGQAQ